MSTLSTFQALDILEAIETINRLKVSWDIHHVVGSTGSDLYNCSVVKRHTGVTIASSGYHYGVEMAITRAVILYTRYTIGSVAYGKVRESLGISPERAWDLSFNAANLLANRLIDVCPTLDSEDA